MSIDFRPLTPIRMADLFDGRLERVGVRQHHPERTLAPNEKCLTDGLKNYLFVYSNEKDEYQALPAGCPRAILNTFCRRSVASSMSILCLSTNRNTGDSRRRMGRCLGKDG